MGTTGQSRSPRRFGANQRSSAPEKEIVEAARFRRSLTLVGISVIAPGSAQFIAGHRRVGQIALAVAAVLATTLLSVLAFVSTEHLAKLAFQPWLLTTFKLLGFALALAWVALIIDAWRLGHPPGLSQKHRLIMVGTTLALVVVVSTPFVVAARYATAAHDAVVEIFGSGEAVEASDGRLNILLLGADADEGRVGLRPDSINLVSIDVHTGKSVMISLPRNLEKARFPEGTPAAKKFPNGLSGEEDLSNYFLNATWTFGEKNPELFPGPSGPGATAVKQAVSGTLDIPVHYYVAVDIQGFRHLVDAIGGVTIRISEEVPIGEKGRVLKPGLQKLDGYETMWYARSREGSSDYSRMARQRCVLGALLHEADPKTVLANFIDLADASKSIVTTDIPRQALSNLVDTALKAKSQKVKSLQFVPPLITPADPDFELIARKTRQLLEDDKASPSQGSNKKETSSGKDKSSSPKEENTSLRAPVQVDPQSVISSAMPEENRSDSDKSDNPEKSDDSEKKSSSDPVDVSSVCSYD